MADLDAQAPNAAAPVRGVVLADFNRPECYLAARRVDALSGAGVAIDWRAVEHERSLHVAARRPSAAERDALADRVAQVERLLLPGETLPMQMPAYLPRTEGAVSAYAEMYGSPVAGEVRRLLFDMYWCRGQDIGSPEVLRRSLAGPVLRSGVAALPMAVSGYAVSVDRGPITTAAWRRIRDWRGQWRDLGSPPPPVLIVDGDPLVGLDAVRRLGELIGDSISPAELAVLDPARYPAARRPPPGWASQIGGRWRYSYRGRDARRV